MLKVDVSVILELTEGWQSRFNEFFCEMRALKWVDKHWDIRVPDENSFEDIFAIARKYEISIIIHS